MNRRLDGLVRAAPVRVELPQRDPIYSEVERLRVEVVQLRAAAAAVAERSEKLLPYESDCPGCGGSDTLRHWTHDDQSGHFDCQCREITGTLDRGCGCKWQEMTYADTRRETRRSELQREERLRSERAERRRVSVMIAKTVISAVAVVAFLLLLLLGVNHG